MGAWVVIDLEWNSAARGVKVDPALAEKMMFEIIEIGAVRLDDQLQIAERFERRVKPTLYKRIQHHIARVTNRTQQSLQHGVSFEQAFGDLLSFSGPNPVFCSWGTSDPEVMLANVRFHKITPEPLFKGLNVQAVFSNLAEGTSRGNQRSIEYALDFLRLKKDLPFHEALSDAEYAALILQRVVDQECQEKKGESVDSLLKPYIFDPFLNSQTDERIELQKKDNILDYLDGRPYACPACGREFKGQWTEIKPDKSWFSKGLCPLHGDIEMTAKRARRTKKPQIQLRIRIPQGPLVEPVPETAEPEPFIWIDPEAPVQE